MNIEEIDTIAMPITEGAGLALKYVSSSTFWGMKGKMPTGQRGELTNAYDPHAAFKPTPAFVRRTAKYMVESYRQQIAPPKRRVVHVSKGK
jgi:hypothetical protein